MVTTKLYKNTSDKSLIIPGLGELEPGAQFSISTEYHQPLVLENFPGLVDLTEADAEEVRAEENVNEENDQWAS